jgi:ABC-type anion transport system duplicated permease subunit
VPIRAYLVYRDWSDSVRHGLRARLYHCDERGDVAPRTVGIAVMAALAIAVGTIITTKVLDRAEQIDLGP